MVFRLCGVGKLFFLGMCTTALPADQQEARHVPLALNVQHTCGGQTMEIVAASRLPGRGSVRESYFFQLKEGSFVPKSSKVRDETERAFFAHAMHVATKEEQERYNFLTQKLGTRLELRPVQQYQIKVRHDRRKLQANAYLNKQARDKVPADGFSSVLVDGESKRLHPSERIQIFEVQACVKEEVLTFRTDFSNLGDLDEWKVLCTTEGKLCPKDVEAADYFSHIECKKR